MIRLIIVNDENEHGIKVKEWLDHYSGYLCDKTIKFLKQFNEDTVIEASIYDLNNFAMQNIN
jgi:hypothetical protein